MTKFINNDDFIQIFEERLKDYTGAPYVVLTDSCTNAIFLSLMYLKNTGKILTPDIVTPNNNYISVPQAIIHAGFNPVYKDIKWKENYQIGDTIIYDYAVGLRPGIYKDGTMQCLSFQQKKAIGIGKGGAILLDNKEAYQTLKRMAWDGRDSSLSVQVDLKNIILGYHMNMIPDDAAKGTLLINQYQHNDNDLGSFSTYPDISNIVYT